MLAHVPRGLVFALARMCAAIGHEATRAAIKLDVPADVLRLARAMEMRFGADLFAPDWRLRAMNTKTMLRECAREMHALSRLAPPAPSLPAPVVLARPTPARHNDHAGVLPDGMGAWSGSHARHHGAHTDRDQVRADEVRTKIAHIVNTEPGSARAQARAWVRSQSLRGAKWGTDDAPNPFLVRVIKYDAPGEPVLDPVERERLARGHRAAERAADYRKSPPLEWTRI